MAHPRSLAHRTMLIGCTLLFLVSCGGPRNPVPTADEARFARLAIFYGRFTSQNQGKPPTNEADFKGYIQSVDANINLDEFFVSPRDKQPYVILYNVRPAPGAASVIAHEKSGVDGKRMVCLNNAEVRTVDEAGLAKLLNQ